MNDLGIAALEEGGRIDFARLRADRLSRAVAEMERADLDALLLGREANARYVSGARRLWTVGTRPFAPTCAFVRRDAAVHLLSTWDDGIPDEVPHANLIQLSWSPANLQSALARIEGLRDARRIGVDGMTPLFEELLTAAFPNTEWVDAGPALQRARSLKTPAEVACLRTACALAEGALASVLPEIRPGAVERQLAGRACEEAARLGVPIPAFEPGFCGGDSGPEPRLLSGWRRLHAGDLVACHVGVMYAGYEGAVGCSTVCTQEGADASRIPTEAVERLTRLRAALRAACVPGTSTAALKRAYQSCGERLPEAPFLQGVGLGVEPPFAGAEAHRGEVVLQPDMVVALYAVVQVRDAGPLLARDTLWITQRGCERLNHVPGSA